MAIPISSYRDRTSEFGAVIERLQQWNRSSSSLTPDSFGSSPSASPSPPKHAAKSSPPSVHSDFNREASKIGLAIHDAAKKVARLSMLTKRSSMFDDPAREIQELMAVVTQDITRFNSMIQQLELADGIRVDMSSHNVEHCKTVLDNLKGRLMGTTNDLKEVLTLRTEYLKAHATRKQLFTASRPNEESDRLSSTIGSETSANQRPPPWAMNPSSIRTPTVRDAADDSFKSTQLRRRTGSAFSSVQIQSEMQQENAPSQGRSRSTALHTIESTITELSSMFTQVATMVSQQAEIAVRIDDNMDDTLTNVEGAQANLLKYLHKVSANRGLIIKIFFALIAFLTVYIIFLS